MEGALTAAEARQQQQQQAPRRRAPPPTAAVSAASAVEAQQGDELDSFLRSSPKAMRTKQRRLEAKVLGTPTDQVWEDVPEQEARRLTRAQRKALRTLKSARDLGKPFDEGAPPPPNARPHR